MRRPRSRRSANASRGWDKGAHRPEAGRSGGRRRRLSGTLLRCVFRFGSGAAFSPKTVFGTGSAGAVPMRMPYTKGGTMDISCLPCFVDPFRGAVVSFRLRTVRAGGFSATGLRGGERMLAVPSSGGGAPGRKRTSCPVAALRRRAVSRSGRGRYSGSCHRPSCRMSATSASRASACGRLRCTTSRPRYSVMRPGPEPT